MAAVSSPEVQLVRGSRCGDERIAEFGVVTLREKAKVLSGSPPNGCINGNAVPAQPSNKKLASASPVKAIRKTDGPDSIF